MPLPTGVVSGPLSADEIILKRFNRVIGEPVVELLERSLARKNLFPLNLALAAVGFLHRCVEHAFAGGPNVGPRAVATDERNGRILGNSLAYRF